MGMGGDIGTSVARMALPIKASALTTLPDAAQQQGALAARGRAHWHFDARPDHQSLTQAAAKRHGNPSHVYRMVTCVSHSPRFESSSADRGRHFVLSRTGH